ncbi:Glycerophosphoryl diester phosphodiesterase [compost metagenome]
MNHNKISIVGHRGAAGEAPENTLGSFQLAVHQGSNAVELDIHLSKDGHLIVCHDYTLDRTTNLKGLIKDNIFDEIQQADAGSWFSSKYAGEHVPSLEEVLELLPPEVRVNVEIKSDSPELRQKLILLLRSKNWMQRVFVSSFNHPCLINLKEEAPEIRIGLLYKEDYIAPSDINKRFNVSIYSLHPHHSLVNSVYMEEAREHQLQVYPWTVNDKDRMLELIELGVSGIITDYPAILHDILK